ncbi:MAG: nucleotidyltransferase family protein [Bacteroidales bacterium]|nr:nucleotidyltransferase family protein [Bacteroidales bacterium]
MHHFAEQIIDFVNKNKFGVNIEISDEREQLLDTGGAILKAKDFFQGEKAFLVYNVDILSDINLFELFVTHINSPALATLAVKDRSTSRQLLFDAEAKLCQWKNVKTGEIKQAAEPFGDLIPYAFSGIHVISTDIFNHISQKGAFSIIDTYLQFAKTHIIRAYVHNYSKWYDMGRYQLLKEFDKNGKLDLFI